CQTKMYYLEPKWYGDPKAMLEFGRACAQTKNWEALLPMLLLNAHLRISQYTDAEGQKKYYQQPEVKRDIKTLLDEYLRLHPNDRYWRTIYVDWALKIGDKAEARRQIKILGNNYSQVYMT